MNYMKSFMPRIGITDYSSKTGVRGCRLKTVQDNSNLTLQLRQRDEFYMHKTLPMKRQIIHLIYLSIAAPQKQDRRIVPTFHDTSPKASQLVLLLPEHQKSNQLSKASIRIMVQKPKHVISD